MPDGAAAWKSKAKGFPVVLAGGMEVVIGVGEAGVGVGVGVGVGGQ